MLERCSQGIGNCGRWRHTLLCKMHAYVKDDTRSVTSALSQVASGGGGGDFSTGANTTTCVYANIDVYMFGVCAHACFHTQEQSGSTRKYVC